MKFADPKNDLAFKKIFGNENHSILIKFLVFQSSKRLYQI